jgi:hypothetical protein
MKFAEAEVQAFLAEALAAAEQYFHTKLEKPLTLFFLTEFPSERAFYPCGWRETERELFLGVIHEINLEATWWNHSPASTTITERLRAATAREILALTLSHEVAHLFRRDLAPVPWNAEAQAMRDGQRIAETLCPTVADLFPTDPFETPRINNTRPETISYADLGRSPDLCRAFQWAAWKVEKV